MFGKPGVTKKNLAAIPLILFSTMFVGTDVLQSILYLLEDPKFYAKNVDESKDIAANSATYATFMSLAALLASGFLYDMLGRRTSLISMFFINAIITISYPLASPSVLGFTILRVVY